MVRVHDRAIRKVSYRAPSAGDGVKPTGDVVGGRYWVHYDRTASKFAERTSESYTTLIDDRTLLSVAGSYSPAVRLRPTWLESRRAPLLKVRDHVVVSP